MCCGKYYYGITFEEIFEFYTFDEELRNCRNVCAHDEHLYDFHIRETIPDILMHQKLQISTKNNQYTMGKQDFYAVVIALRYLISNDDFKAFKAALTKLINKVTKQCPHLTREQLVKGMGFPENWEKIMRYKK